MDILITKGWGEYELIDSGFGRRLERFGKYRLVRPDPQAIWKPHKSESVWNGADAIFNKSKQDQGYWKMNRQVPETWNVTYEKLILECRLTPFKHTGIFPEQVINWEWMHSILSKTTGPKRVLNLFAYTGVSSLVCAQAGAHVTHVDSSFPTIGWAKHNQELSGLASKPIRWILDDAMKFCAREVKRNQVYDAIIMDPPVYGHGPKGELWNFSDSFPELLNICQKLLSPQPLFVLINAYAISSSALMLQNTVHDYMSIPFKDIHIGELALQESSSDRLLSTGLFARWSRETQK